MVLPLVAQDNVLCDHAAKAIYEMSGRLQMQPSTLPIDEEWGLSLGGLPLSRLDEDLLYEQCWGDDTLKYWAKKFEWSPDTTRAVNWDLLRDAFGSLTFAERRRTVKFASGNMGVGVKLLEWGFDDNDLCPLCGMPQEDNLHVLKCPDSRAAAQWSISVQELQITCERLDTNPGITRVIVAGVRSIRRPHTSLDSINLPIKQAIQEQTNIGWFQLCCGFHSRRWLALQERYIHSLPVEKHPSYLRRWVKSLALKLMQVAWDMWRHRNGVKHGTGLTPAQKAREQRIDDLLAEQYRLGTDSLRSQHHRFLTDRSLEQTVTQLDLDTKQQLLHSLELAREAHARHKATQRTRQAYEQRNALRTWLSSGAATNDTPQED